MAKFSSLSNLGGFLKDTVIYGLASITPRLVSFALVPIHTLVLNTTNYSNNTNFYVYAAFLNAFLTFGMETSFFRFFTAEKEKNRVVSTSFISLLTISLIFVLLAFPMSEQIAQLFGFSDVTFIKLLIATIFFDTLVVIPFAYLRVQGKSIHFAALRIINVIVTLLLNILFLLVLPKLPSSAFEQIPLIHYIADQIPNETDIFIANLMASILTLGLCLPIIKAIKFEFDTVLLKKFLNYGLPIMIAGLAYVVNENFDKIIIARLLGEETNGIYAACYKMGVFMTIYIMAFRMGAEPFFFNQASKENAKSTYSTIMTWFVILACFCMMTVTAYTDFFASLLLKQDIYLQGLAIVPVILLANLMLGVYNNLSIWYKLTDRTKVGMYISILGAIFTIVALIFLLPRYGYMAAAYTTLFTYSFMALSSYFLGKKYYPVPYNVSKILVYIAISTSISFSFFYLFRNQIILNTVILILCLLIVFYIENLTKLLKSS